MMSIKPLRNARTKEGIFSLAIIFFILTFFHMIKIPTLVEPENIIPSPRQYFNTKSTAALYFRGSSRGGKAQSSGS